MFLLEEESRSFMSKDPYVPIRRRVEEFYENNMEKKKINCVLYFKSKDEFNGTYMCSSAKKTNK